MLPGAGLTYQNDIFKARSDAILGDLEASGKRVHLAEFIKDLDEQTSFGFQLHPASDYGAQYFKHGKYDTFYDIVRMFRDNHSSDPRDKIYGLLGLAASKHVETAAVKPDYSMPLDALYCHYIRSPCGNLQPS